MMPNNKRVINIPQPCIVFKFACSKAVALNVSTKMLTTTGERTEPFRLQNFACGIFFGKQITLE